MDAKGPAKPSKTEGLKLASNYLRANLAEDAVGPGPSMSEDSAQIIKFHGSYQQDDRDVRTARKKEGLDKAYSFMIRTRIPGGAITAQQYLTHDHLCRTYGGGGLRITTRQEFQIHGVLKTAFKPVIQAINQSLLTTLATCGDVERNVLCCPAPYANDPIRAAIRQDTRKLVSHFAPRSTAYYDIWLDGERYPDPAFPAPGPALVPTPGDDEVEPLYGKAYMPRKFKTAFALPEDNCVDVYANDLGFIAVVEGGQLVGYNVVVGGGMGTTPSAAKTFAAVALELCYVPREDYLRVGEAVLKVQRDFGNRSDRKRARLKYVIYDWGMPAFRAKVEEYLGTPLAPSRLLPALEIDDHLGWHEQGDGKLWVGLPIDSGRLRDDGDSRLLTGLRTFFEKYGTPARLTCLQSILLADIEPAWKDDVERILHDHGIPTVDRVSTIRRWSMACPALPTCGLAVTESERVLPALIERFEAELEALGLGDERIALHMTGCPNGCARPYNCEIGLVGRSALKTEDGGNDAGTYTIFLGGRATGERLNSLYKDYVPFDQVVPELVTVLRRFREERQPGEPFGDFCDRVGVESLAGAGDVIPSTSA